MQKAATIIALLVLITVQSFGQDKRKPKNVAIFIFNAVQIIDYTGPYEVFINASSGNFSQFNVFTVAETTDTINTIGDMKVLPAYSFKDHPKPDVLVLPGGWGVSATWKKPQVLQWIREQAKESGIVLSVCNGAILLATAGLLDSLSATSTSGVIDVLAREVPGLKPVYDKRYVDNGKIITSAGLTAGIDGALHVVERMLGKGWAQRVALDMEYNWQPESDYARALLADKYIPPSWWLFKGIVTDPISYNGTRNEWVTKDVLNTKLSSREIIDTIIFRMEGDKNPNKWTQKSAPQIEGEGYVSNWNFIDKQGNYWDASFRVSPFNNEPKKLLMIASVKRK